MNRAGALLSLLRISDSFFPSGAFAYSWGLETCVCDGSVKSAEGLAGFLEAYLEGLVSRCDALVVKLSFDAADSGDKERLLRLDGLLNAMKPARESREGSIRVGNQILRVIGDLHQEGLCADFLEAVKANRAFGHHPVAFGLVCAMLGVPKESALQGYLYQCASGLVSAGIRLIPLGHMDGQKVMERIQPKLIAVAEGAMHLQESDISSFAPGIEIRAMRHEYLHTRLFRS